MKNAAGEAVGQYAHAARYAWQRGLGRLRHDLSFVGHNIFQVLVLNGASEPDLPLLEESSATGSAKVLAGDSLLPVL